MLQEIVVESQSCRTMLSLEVLKINDLFPGFCLGDFALIHGTSSIDWVASVLCCRAQLPTQLGGLASKVIFIDGGESFQLSTITRLAKLQRMNPKEVLACIQLSSVSTAYQLTTVILRRLEERIRKSKAKLVIISEIATAFLDEKIDDEEGKRIYNQIALRLSSLAKELNIIIIATMTNRSNDKRGLYCQILTHTRANVSIAINGSRNEHEFVLEKHPYFTLGSAEIAVKTLPLTAFAESRF